MSECQQAKNLERCTCTNIECPRRGKCCACASYRRIRGEMPGCYFSKEAEKTYDRSFENYMRDRKSKAS
jgi:hypothetical protein